MKQNYTTTLRLNLENEAARRAREHLQSLDRREYRSVSKAVVSAVNAYFDRSKQLADDPYLETREKEDAFLSRIEDTISRSLQSCTPVSLGGILQLMQSAQPAAALVSEETEEEPDMANKKIMTKEELQAKHRLEEAQMRDRAKERKARTRRLIQEGAVLEKVFPEAQQMELEKLEDLLYEKLH